MQLGCRLADRVGLSVVQGMDVDVDLPSEASAFCEFDAPKPLF